MIPTRVVFLQNKRKRKINRVFPLQKHIFYIFDPPRCLRSVQPIILILISRPNESSVQSRPAASALLTLPFKLTEDVGHACLPPPRSPHCNAAQSQFVFFFLANTQRCGENVDVRRGLSNWCARTLARAHFQFSTLEMFFVTIDYSGNIWSILMHIKLL